MAFTKELRQQIIEDFAKRHDGVYDPEVFVREVKKQGERHPAFSWFVWDDTKAASEHRLWQARVFAQGLVVRFKVEEIGRRGAIRIVESEMPFVLSPMEGRGEGGGYRIVDPHDPTHMAMLAGEGSVALRSWLRRYSAALRVAGIPVRVIEHAAEAMERAAGGGIEEAAE
jgi:hypothetical protein